MKECVDGCNTVHYQGVNVSYDFPKRAKYNPPEIEELSEISSESMIGNLWTALGCNGI